MHNAIVVRKAELIFASLTDAFYDFVSSYFVELFRSGFNSLLSKSAYGFCAIVFGDVNALVASSIISMKANPSRIAVPIIPDIS